MSDRDSEAPRRGARHLIDRPRGEYVFRQGDLGEEMYIIQKGRIEIVSDTHDGRRRLAVFEKGDFFGEMSLLEDLPRSASARAVEDSRLVRVDRGTFDKMLRADPEIAVRIMRKLSRRLRETDRLLGERPEIGEAGRTATLEGPDSAAPYRLVHAASGIEFPLTRGGVSTVGRSDPVTGIRPEVDLVSVDPDRSASRRHAKLYYEGDQFFVVEDIGTTNGTFHNGRRVQAGIPVPVTAGDRLRFGLVELELEADPGDD